MFDSSYLTACAVEVVKGYVVDGTSLSDGVAKVATRDSLNTEQISRVVEVVNQVAYLKFQQEASDKTFEFKVAEIPEVLTKMTTPSSHVDLTKSASTKSPLDLFCDGHEKVAETSLLDRMSDDERFSLIHKGYVVATAQMEKMAHQERELIEDLASHLALCRRDPEMLEKVAYLTDGDPDAVTQTSKMLTGQVKIAACNQIFYSEDLNHARKLIGLVKQAYEFQEKKAALAGTLAKAGDYLKAKTVGGKNMLGRAKQNMPGKVGVALTAPFFESKTPVWSSLQKIAE